MKIKIVLEQQKEKIRPSEEETKNYFETANDFLKKLQTKGLDAQIGGSLAKGTMIKKDKQDIDIFVVFNFSEDILGLEKILKKTFTVEKIHGSRDYFKIDYPKAVLEVIPVVKNVNPELAENVTDVSLSHVKYIKNKIKKNPQVADEIRLAKSFCHGQNCYGAESYVRGFSGYALEVLIIHFGNFIKFLKGIQKKKIIDPEKYFRNEKEILRELNASKISGPLILIDPTYKYRNILAGLNEETYLRFVDSAKKFLKNPSADFFEKKEINLDELKNAARKENALLVKIELETDRQEGDIAGTKMKKFFDFFESELKRKQQKITRKEFDYTGKEKKANGFLVIKENKKIEIRGPAVGLEQAIKNFSKARKEVYRKNGFYYAKENISVKEIFDGCKKEAKEMGITKAAMNYEF